MPYKDRSKQLAYQREWNRKYFQTHKEERKLYLREWRVRNPEKNSLYCKRWQEKNIEKRRKYFQKWRETHRDYLRKFRAKYYKRVELRRRFELIMAKGGKCEICGYDACFCALEFHHFDPKEKNGDKEWKKTGFDLSKVILVCANCHKFIHGQTAEEFYTKWRKESISLERQKRTLITSSRMAHSTTPQKS